MWPSPFLQCCYLYIISLQLICDFSHFSSLEQRSDIPCCDIKFHSLHPFTLHCSSFRNWVASPISNPHPGGPRFVFRVFSPRWVSFSTLMEALLPLVFFQGFPSLSLWDSFPSPARQRWHCLFSGGTHLPGHKTILENM